MSIVEADPRYIVGRPLGLKEWREEIAVGTEFIAGIRSLRVGWENKCNPTANITGLLVDDFLPPRSPPWRHDQNNSFDWEHVSYLVLNELYTGETFTYRAKWPEEHKEIGKLAWAYGDRLQRGSSKYMPVIKLTRVDEHTPVFKIIKWALPNGVDEMVRFDYGDQLCCPRCGAHNLHQIGVTVYDRYEDAEQLIKTDVVYGHSDYHYVDAEEMAKIGVLVDDDEVYDRHESKTSVSTVTAKGSGNPSARRQGLTIKFDCEHCEGSHVLTIAQHKGTTYVKWRS
jgi:hypothetical protein